MNIETYLRIGKEIPMSEFKKIEQELINNEDLLNKVLKQYDFLDVNMKTMSHRVKSGDEIAGTSAGSNAYIKPGHVLESGTPQMKWMVNNPQQISIKGKKVIKRKKSLNEILEQETQDLMNQATTQINHDMNERKPYNHKIDLDVYETIAQKAINLGRKMLGNIFDQYLKNHAHNANLARIVVLDGLRKGMKEDELVTLYQIAALKDIGANSEGSIYKMEHVNTAKMQFYDKGIAMSPLKEHVKNSVRILKNSGFDEIGLQAVALQYNPSIKGYNSTAKKYATIIAKADEALTRMDKGEAIESITKRFIERESSYKKANEVLYKAA